LATEVKSLKLQQKIKMYIPYYPLSLDIEIIRNVTNIYDKPKNIDFKLHY